MDVTRTYDIPADVATGFASFDYFDFWTARSQVQATPEQLARATMEGAHRAGRFLAWQTVLGLRLSQGPETVAGWRIIERTDSSIVMETKGWFMTAHAVFHVAPGRVSFGVFVTYQRSVGKVIWGTAVSAVHRAVSPGFLAAGVRRVERVAA